MKGKTIGDFIDTLLLGGCDMEYVYRNERYLIEAQYNAKVGKIELYIVKCEEEKSSMIFSCLGNTLQDCVAQYEEAKLYDGRTIYEAENEIEVLFG